MAAAFLMCSCCSCFQLSIPKLIAPLYSSNVPVSRSSLIRQFWVSVLYVLLLWPTFTILPKSLLFPALPALLMPGTFKVTPSPTWYWFAMVRHQLCDLTSASHALNMFFKHFCHMATWIFNVLVMMKNTKVLFAFNRFIFLFFPFCLWKCTTSLLSCVADCCVWPRSHSLGKVTTAKFGHFLLAAMIYWWGSAWDEQGGSWWCCYPWWWLNRRQGCRRSWCHQWYL